MVIIKKVIVLSWNQNRLFLWLRKMFHYSPIYLIIFLSQHSLFSCHLDIIRMILPNLSNSFIHLCDSTLIHSMYNNIVAILNLLLFNLNVNWITSYLYKVCSQSASVSFISLISMGLLSQIITIGSLGFFLLMVSILMIVSSIKN